MTNRKFDAVIFDFDGTIADTFNVFVNILQENHKKYGIPRFDDEEINELRNHSKRKLVKTFKVPFYKAPFVLKDVRQKMGDALLDVNTFGTLVTVMERLIKDGMVVGVATGNSSSNVKKYFERLNVEGVAFVESSNPLFGKDHDLKKVIRKFNLTKDRTLYVGDEIDDIKDAHDVGIKVAAVGWGYNSKESLEKHNPDFMLLKPEDLLSIIYK